MKANARIAGNSTCQDLLYWNWGRLDHYKADMKPILAEKELKITSSVPIIHIDKPDLEFCDYLQKKRFYVIFRKAR